MSDEQILAAVVGLTTADLDAAWEYVAVNRAEIDQAIADNETGEAESVE
jgi:uncharacterized protein (DUF433 family)